MKSEYDFMELFDTYNQSVYRFACYLTHNIQEAEDLFQDTWLSVVENFDKTVKIKDYKSWIFTITVNKYRDLWRKKKIRQILTFSSEAELNSKTNTVNEIDAADIRMAIKGSLKKLSVRQRTVFVLKEIEGYKHEEVSKILAVPVGTVKSLLHRAIKNVQKELSGYNVGGNNSGESRG